MSEGETGVEPVSVVVAAAASILVRTIRGGVPAMGREGDSVGWGLWAV